MLVHRAVVVLVPRADRHRTQPHAPLFAPSWLVRLKAHLRARALDRALSDGANPASDPQLAARAAELTGASMRGELADALERLARTETQPRSPRRVLPFRRAMRTNAQALRELTDLLRSSTPVYARGVAMLRVMVTDGTGPAYTDRDGHQFAARLELARSAIAGLGVAG